MIIQSQIFRRFENVLFGVSGRFAPETSEPYFFNMSLSVGDDSKIVKQNRSVFFNKLGLGIDNVAFQKQIHSDIITYVSQAGNCGQSDAMITDKPGIGLAVSSADCVPVFIYDNKNKVIAGIHSGWRGTEKKIVEKTILKLQNGFGANPEELFAYIGPSISQANYEVDKEVADKFDGKYLMSNGNGKFLLNVSGACYDMLLCKGIPHQNIQHSGLCTFGMNNLLHSYRRDGLKSGRQLGVIALINR
jgi:YfiH family protein